LIRPATPADIATLRQIEAHSVSAAHWTDQEYNHLFAGESPRTVLVIEEGVLLGFLVAHQIGPEWELENIAIEPSAQRRGLASALLLRFFEILRQKQAGSVFLEVRASNAAARALYEKHGFSQAGRRRDYYDHPAEDAILYRKAIGSS
jgi:ribosomal-protein-alanine N-acetyltransferase